MSAQFLTNLKKSGLPLVIIGLFILFSGACSLEKPEAPTWDTQFSIPLISKHYDMYELVDRMAEDALGYDSNGTISLAFEQEVDTIVIDAGLSVSSVNTEADHQLGNITIEPPDPLSVDLNLTDYLSISAGVVPESGFNANKEFEIITDFETATFSDGQMILSITNNFDLYIDSLTIWILNEAAQDTVAEYNFYDGLDINETKIDTVELQGKSVSDQLSLSSRIHTPGGTLLTVSDKNLGIELGFSDEVTVSSAQAIVPAQSKDFSSSVSFSESHQLTQASLSSGAINITIENTSELAATLTVNINELRESGSPFAIEAYIPANGTFNYNTDLSGYNLSPEIVGNKMALNIDLDAEFPGSGGNVVVISSSDEFSVEAVLSDLEFSQATGIIAPTVIEMQTIEESVDLPEGMENISLSDALITLNLYSEIDIPAEVDIDLYGDGGQHLNIYSEIAGGSPGNPGVTEVVIDNLNNFLNPVPQSITVSGTALAGDGATSGTVYSDSKVWGTFEITSPLKFAVGETTVEGDVNSTDIDQDDIDEISERLLEATIYATLTNHLPFACEVELYFSGDSATLYSDPQLIIGPVEVSGGTVDGNGLVTNAAVSEITIHLSETDLDIIENATLYVGQYIYLAGTNGQMVNILNSDYLDIDAFIELTTRLGGEWD
jgi:hypothetical protein